MDGLPLRSLLLLASSLLKPRCHCADFYGFYRTCPGSHHCHPQHSAGVLRFHGFRHSIGQTPLVSTIDLTIISSVHYFSMKPHLPMAKPAIAYRLLTGFGGAHLPLGFALR